MAGALWENGWQRPTCKYGMQTCGGNFTWLPLRRMLISDTARKMLFPHFSLLALEVDCKDVIFSLLSAYRILLYFVSVRFGWTCSIYDNITSLANTDSLYRVFAVTYFSWGISKAKNPLKMRYCDSIYFTLFVFEAVSHNVEQEWPELLAIPLPQFTPMLGMYVEATMPEWFKITTASAVKPENMTRILQFIFC